MIRSPTDELRLRRVGKGALTGLTRGQNRARAVPTRPLHGRRFCPPYGMRFMEEGPT